MSTKSVNIYPLSVTGTLRDGAVLRILDSKRAIATCGSDVNPSTFYQSTQSEPSTAWTIAHNLGFAPSIRAFSVGGREMIGEVIHQSMLQSTIYFDTPVCGFATCS